MRRERRVSSAHLTLFRGSSTRPAHRVSDFCVASARCRHRNTQHNSGGVSGKDCGAQLDDLGYNVSRMSPHPLNLAIVLVFSAASLFASDPVVNPVIKRAEVDITNQVLRAYEDEKLVFETPVSTGKRDGSTPRGHFTVGVKHRFHYSKRYHNAPMPFSVQISGHVFIHGFSQVPAYPASHGCIRVPLTGENPAMWFFNWAEPGMPVDVSGRWVPPPRQSKPPK